MEGTAVHTVIMGLGNILCGDEGLGVRLAERLYAHYDFPPEVLVVDGGTQGMPLLTFVERARHLLLLDAVDFGREPGSVVMQHGDMPTWVTAKKLSAHQSSFAEVLGMARFRGHFPQVVDLVGMQPVDLTYGADLSPQVRAALPELEQAAIEICRGYGIDPVPTTVPRHLNAPCLYSVEACRPACGDTPAPPAYQPAPSERL